MATVIKPELSTKNKYWIDKHRYYELKHFCLQYKQWKKAYATINDVCISASNFQDRFPGRNIHVDLTAKYAIMKASYRDKIELVEDAALNADENLYSYILAAVTEGHSYDYLETKMDIPCSRDMYYDRYRKFFWILSESRK